MYARLFDNEQKHLSDLTFCLACMEVKIFSDSHRIAAVLNVPLEGEESE